MNDWERVGVGIGEGEKIEWRGEWVHSKLSSSITLHQSLSLKPLTYNLHKIIDFSGIDGA